MMDYHSYSIKKIIHLVSELYLEDSILYGKVSCDDCDLSDMKTNVFDLGGFGKFELVNGFKHQKDFKLDFISIAPKGFYD
jgi:hypothetical protein